MATICWKVNNPASGTVIGKKILNRQKENSFTQYVKFTIHNYSQIAGRFSY